jgi:NAD(P)-dependent dehydrogenase (short-subunit alcohol dehydrogenase family)
MSLVSKIHKSTVRFSSRRFFSFNSDGKCSTAVISTASRGIGLEFARQLLDKGFHCILLVRDKFESVPQPVQDLNVSYGPKCDVIGGLNLEDQESVENVCKQVGNLLNGQELNLLLNVAGILHESDGKPEKSVHEIKRSWLEKSLAINFVGHCMMTTNLLPYMYKNKKMILHKKGEEQHNSNVQDDPYNCVCNVSARVGSITDNQLGGWLSYRASKAALNMFTKTLAIEVQRKGVLALSLHPGTVDTDLSKPFQKNVKKNSLIQLQSKELAVGRMLEVILGMNIENTGGFFAYDGSRIKF